MIKLLLVTLRTNLFMFYNLSLASNSPKILLFSNLIILNFLPNFFYLKLTHHQFNHFLYFLILSLQCFNFTSHQIIFLFNLIHNLFQFSNINSFNYLIFDILLQSIQLLDILYHTWIIICFKRVM